ncbi:MAG: SEC-C metal-binding domain-containing protein [Candidatus Krumholzibacteriaceae bacterium]|jgi:uncharacterized protein YecA (UPF0149 family)
MTSEWVAACTALLSAIAAVLAWAAKLWWGKEYRNAKDETIKAKDAQIAAIERELSATKELTPMKIREYFLSMKEQLEEYIDGLKADLKKKNDDIERLVREGRTKGEEISRLQREKSGAESNLAIYLAKSHLFQNLTANLATWLEPYVSGENGVLVSTTVPTVSIVDNVRSAVDPNAPCPCRSGKQYKDCCGAIQKDGSTQVGPKE